MKVWRTFKTLLHGLEITTAEAKSEIYLSFQDFAEMEPEWVQAEWVKAESWLYCFI